MYLGTEIEYNPALPANIQSDIDLRGLIAVIQKMGARFRALASNQEVSPHLTPAHHLPIRCGRHAQQLPPSIPQVTWINRPCII